MKLNLTDKLSKAVSSIGEAQGETALRRNCYFFLYEPKIPQELLKKEEK